MAQWEEWDELAKRLFSKGSQLFDAADPPVTDLGPRDPTVVGLALLARTLGAMRAAILLLDNDHVIEARTITRSVHENLFFAAALAKKGALFVDEIEADDATNRQKRANGLRAFFAETGAHPDKQDDLETLSAQLRNEHGKTNAIVMIQAAAAGGVGDAYIVYRELSTDAAHPSAASLSRHLTINDDPEAAPFTVHGAPMIDQGEAADTLGLLCMGVLSTLIAIDAILGGVKVGEPLDDLTKDYQPR